MTPLYLPLMGRISPHWLVRWHSLPLQGKGRGWGLLVGMNIK